MTNNQADQWGRIFSFLPGVYELLEADTFNLVAISNDLLEMIQKNREEVLGKYLFDAFPPFPGSSPEQIIASFNKVKETKKEDILPTLRYDIELSDGIQQAFMWLIGNYPVLSEDGDKVEFIIIHAENVSALVELENLALALNTLSDSVNKSVGAVLSIREKVLRGGVG